MQSANQTVTKIIQPVVSTYGAVTVVDHKLLDPASVYKATTMDGDAVANRILAAFDGHEYLNGTDLIAAAGVGREQYLDVLDTLITETGELVEVEAEASDPEPFLYARPKPRRKAEGGI